MGNREILRLAQQKLLEAMNELDQLDLEHASDADKAVLDELRVTWQKAEDTLFCRL